MAEPDALHPEFADLWPDSRGRIDARLADLERGVSGLEQGSLSEDDRVAARAAAHKLIGTLGTYGLRATAHSLRVVLDALDEPGSADPADLRARYDATVTAVERAA